MSIQPELDPYSQARPEQRVVDSVIGTAQLLLDESLNTRKEQTLGLTRWSTSYTLEHPSHIQIGYSAPISFSSLEIRTGVTRPGEKARSVTLTFGGLEAESSNPRVVEVSRSEISVRDTQDGPGIMLDAGAAEVFLASFDDSATELLQ